MPHVHVVILCTGKTTTTTTTAWSLFIVLGSLYFSVSGDSPLQFCHLVCHNVFFFMSFPVSSDSCFLRAPSFLQGSSIYVSLNTPQKNTTTTHCNLFISFPGLQIQSIGVGREAAASLQHTNWNPSRSHQSGEVSFSRSLLPVAPPTLLKSHFHFDDCLAAGEAEFCSVTKADNNMADRKYSQSLRAFTALCLTAGVGPSD